MSRLTRQQQAISDALEGAGRPLSIEEIHAEARETIPSLGIATVYRAVRKLTEAEVAVPVSLPGEPDRYEHRCCAEKHHHHFKCEECSRVFDIHGCPGGMRAMLPEGFTLHAHHITLFGLCDACRSEPPPARARRGFTLVELLVVIAVVALLVGVLLPALGTARSAAQTAACMSNLRQLVLAQAAYSEDHKGRLVTYGLAHGPVELDESLAWLEDLREYLDPIEGVTRSPADRSPHWSAEDGGSGIAVPRSQGLRFRRTSYGLNEHLTPDAPAHPITGRRIGRDNIYKVRQPATLIQWVRMAERGEFAGSDHVHAASWGNPVPIPDLPARRAAQQMQIDANGGPRTFADDDRVLRASPEARAPYAYLGGSVSVRTFAEVYRSINENQFNPLLQE